MPPNSTQPPLDDVDAVLSRIDTQTQAAIDAVERARTFTAGLSAVRGRGRVEGVSVVVDHVGLLLGVTYTEQSTRTGPERLAQATMSALVGALDDALAQVRQRTHETWGDDPVSGQIVAEVADRFAVVPR